MTWFRIALGAAGVAVLGYGAFVLLTTQRFDQLVWLGLWLAGALIINDGIIVPLSALVAKIIGAATGNLPEAAKTGIWTGLTVAGTLVLIAIPMIVASARGPRNPTVVPHDYLANLGWLLAGLALVVAIQVFVSVRLAARRTSASLQPTQR